VLLYERNNNNIIINTHIDEGRDTILTTVRDISSQRLIICSPPISLILVLCVLFGLLQQPPRKLSFSQHKTSSDTRESGYFFFF